MLTGDEYLKSVRDDRRLYFDGELVQDPQNHPMFAIAFQGVADFYDRMFDADADAGPYYVIPQNVEELRDLMNQLATWDDLAAVTSQGLTALLTAAARMSDDPACSPYVARIQAFHKYCKENDLRCVQAITDAKGDRRLPPSKQDDPDVYTRIVERRPDGVVINGAKLHITASAVAHEMIIMPTKMMKPGEEDWAIACAIPMNAKGVSVVNTTYAPRGDDPEYWPVSGRTNIPEGFIILDHVFVPNDRIFLAGEVQHSATFAHSLGLWERLGSTAHMAQCADTLAGFAQLISDANGLTGISHVKEKIAEMVIYATLIRGCLEAAVTHAEKTPEGWVHPSELYTNAAKHYGAAEFNTMIRNLHDIAGGAVLTAPTPRDMANAEVGPLVRKYMRGKEGVDAAYRARLFHAIRDYTADAYGGWWLVTQLQSGGGLFAQRLVAAKHYPMQAAMARALRVANFPSEDEQPVSRDDAPVATLAPTGGAPA
jgi:4-hydroxybutyryl-CoA dehydratase/vinylacetyl-CoA-Delta-isomerase